MEALQNAYTSVQPHVKSLFSSLPSPVHKQLINLLGSTCYASLVLDAQPTIPCSKLALSKAMGLGIVGISSIVKIPQLLKLVNSKSSKGVSFLSYLLETSAFLISLSYNIRNGFPFSTFGETALISVQNIAICLLVLHFSGKDSLAAAFVAGLAGVVYTLIFAGESLISAANMKYLMSATIPLSLASKVPQILANYQNGGTGQLSAFAVFNYLGGSLARVFTTLQEVDDPIILYGFLGGAALNAVIALQMMYYWNSPASNAAAGVKGKGRKLSKTPAARVIKSGGGVGTGSESETSSPRKRTGRKRQA